jgi:hypothetical protein
VRRMAYLHCACTSVRVCDKCTRLPPARHAMHEKMHDRKHVKMRCIFTPPVLADQSVQNRTQLTARMLRSSTTQTPLPSLLRRSWRTTMCGATLQPRDRVTPMVPMVPKLMAMTTTPHPGAAACESQSAGSASRGSPGCMRNAEELRPEGLLCRMSATRTCTSLSPLFVLVLNPRGAPGTGIDNKLFPIPWCRGSDRSGSSFALPEVRQVSEPVGWRERKVLLVLRAFPKFPLFFWPSGASLASLFNGDGHESFLLLEDEGA